MLILSNGYWVFQVVDQGVTQSYRDQQVYELEETRKQLMHMVPELAANLPKKKIVEIASLHSSEELFEKDGCVWVGWIGMKFDENGKLKSVSPTWNYGDKDLCFPE